MKINVTGLLHDMEIGVGNINRVMRNAGFPPLRNPRQDLNGWKLRNSIPSKWLIRLLWINRTRSSREQVDALSYTQKGTNWKRLAK